MCLRNAAEWKIYLLKIETKQRRWNLKEGSSKQQLDLKELEAFTNDFKEAERKAAERNDG